MCTEKNQLNIVCISPVPWDYPIWTNRQHIMYRIAKHHRVLYVFHPVLLRSSIKRNISLKNLKIFSLLKTINSNLNTYTPFIIPGRTISPIIDHLNIKLSSFFLKKIIKQLNYEKYILWFYDPEGVAYLENLRPELTCYDCVDKFSTMPDYQTPRKKKRLTILENDLVKKCDLVFTTSENIYQEKIILNSKTFLIENVGDFDHFHKVEKEKTSIPGDFPPVTSPVIGFVGAIDNYKVDFELINYIAEKRPDWNIVLIGSRMSSKGKDINYPVGNNVFYLGGKDYKSLPNYIAQFDVCIIPYRINDYTTGVFPIKFFEFLATGKPVVSTALPSLKEYRKVVEIAETHNQFLDAVEKYLFRDSGDIKAKRLNIARQNTWESRKDKLISRVLDELRTRTDEDRN